MDKRISKGIFDIIFRSVVSIIVFGAVMAIIGFLYKIFSYIDISNVPDFITGALWFFLGALSFVGSLTLALYLSAWIFGGLIDNDN